MEEINKLEISRQVSLEIIRIGDVIRKKRMEKGLSQQTLAFYILSDKCLISEIERGHAKNITLSTLCKIAFVLEINVKDFFI